MSTRSSKRKGKIVFWSFFGVFFTTLIVLSFPLMNLLKDFLTHYEASQEYHAIEEIRERLENGESSGIFDFFKYEIPAMETEESVRQYLLNKIADKPIVLKQNLAYGDHGYRLMAGDSEVAQVYLKSAGFDKYENERFELDEIKGFKIPTQSITLQAPADADVFLNGQKLDSSFAIEEDIQYEGLAEHFPEGTAMPSMKTYTADGFIQAPTFHAVSPDGRRLAHVVDDKGKETEKVRFLMPFATDEFIAVHTEMIMTNAKTYTTYTSNDTPFKNVAEFLIHNSQLYKNLRSMEVNWFTNHDSYRFENFAVSEVYQYGEGVFSCRVDYDYYVTRRKTDFHYPTSLMFYYVQLNGKWIVSDLVILQQSN